MYTSTIYRKNVRSLCELNSSETFSNGRRELIPLVLTEYIRRAKYSVKIFDFDLTVDVFGDKQLIHQIKAAHHRGVYIEVITQSQPEDQEILEYIDLIVSDNVSVNELDLNFAVMDTKSFRCFSRKDAQGQASFNSSKTARSLEKSFDTIRDKLSK